MTKGRTFLLGMAFIALLLAGGVRAEECGSAKIDEATRKFSVELRGASGMEDQSFDDIGCAVQSRNNECATRQGIFDSNARTWDHATGEQVPVEKAYFVLRTDVQTPKGFGIVAFKDKAQAEAFSEAHGKGKVIKWYQLVDEPLR